MSLKMSLIQGVKEQNKFNNEQSHLKEKYHIKDGNVVIVEKNNMIKFLIRYAITLFRFLFRIAIIVLATSGLLAFIYPSSRIALWNIIIQIKNQLLSFI